MCGGWLEGKANKLGEDIDAQVSKSALAKATEEKRRYDDEATRKAAADAESARSNAAKEGLTQAQIDAAAEVEKQKKEADDKDRRLKQAQGMVELAYVNDDGVVDDTITSWAVPTENNTLEHLGGAGEVDQKRWVTRDNPNLVAARKGDLGAEGRTAPAKIQENYWKATGLSESIDGLNEMYNLMTPEQQKMLDTPWTDVGLGMVDRSMPEGMQRIAEEKIFDENPTLGYRIKAGKLEGDISKLMAGLTVTGFEMKDRKKWSPMAEGISQEQRQQRLNIIQGVVDRERGYFERTYPAYSLSETVEDDGAYAGFSSTVVED